MTISTTLFLLEHSYERGPGAENRKLIGLYTSRNKAQATVARLRTQPGFRDWPDKFVITEYPLDEDHWTDGF